MKTIKYSPYATNKGGKIDALKKQSTTDPKSTKSTANDLRTKRG